MDKENFPKHVAIIMDGNRRWAREHKVPVPVGHKEGAKTIENLVRYANKIGIKYLTVYAFSTENWKRSEEEVSALMILLKNYLDDYTKRADTENIKVCVWGDISAFNEGLRKSIIYSMEKTKNNTGIQFNICLNYGGRDEMTTAMKKIAKEVKDGKLNVEDITEDLISKNLYSANVPDPDLMIRTSGEIRTSGFLLWQMAYTEFVFVDKYWPDFGEKDLDECIEIYQKRNRKFGRKIINLYIRTNMEEVMNIKRILTALIGIPIVALIFLFGNKYIVDIAIAIIACFAIYEYFNACKKEVKNLSWIGYILAISIAFLHIVSVKTAVIAMLIEIPAVLLILFLHVIITEMKISLKDIAYAFFGITYIISFIVFIPLIYGIGDATPSKLAHGESFIDTIISEFRTTKATGKYLIWYVMWTAWASDIFAYCIGKHFGKHKFSKVSPNKTIEGCVAGVVGAVILSLIYTKWLNSYVGFMIDLKVVTIMSIVLCIIGQIGDFAASTIKRYFNVKDFSELFPGHGGMIDRIDSVMFVAPFAFIAFIFVL
jgi:undecaprenyl diphosphate synthase